LLIGNGIDSKQQAAKLIEFKGKIKGKINQD